MDKKKSKAESSLSIQNIFLLFFSGVGLVVVIAIAAVFIDAASTLKKTSVLKEANNLIIKSR